MCLQPSSSTVPAELDGFSGVSSCQPPGGGGHDEAAGGVDQEVDVSWCQGRYGAVIRGRRAGELKCEIPRDADRVTGDLETFGFGSVGRLGCVASHVHCPQDRPCFGCVPWRA